MKKFTTGRLWQKVLCMVYIKTKSKPGMEERDLRRNNDRTNDVF